jgi:phage terminase large subunit-like protein
MSTDTRWLHPVTAYARRVSGDEGGEERIVAGPLVRLAAARHLRDLEDGHTRGLTFDVARATKAIEFFRDYLTYPDHPRFAGKPFVLSPYQEFIVGSLAGWRGPDGGQRFGTAYIELGKGNGKTPMGAGYMLFHLLAARTPVQVYSAANSQRQAGDLFRDAERMVARSPLLRKRFESTAGNLAVPSTGSFFRVVSSERRTLDGLRVFGAAIDEVHEQADSQVIDKIQAGVKGIPDALILLVTNSGFDRESVCWRIHDYSQKVLDGTLTDDTWFAYICALDEGDDPLADSTCWPKANPNLDVSITTEYLQKQVREAVGMPSKQGLIKRLNFCVWTDTATTWIPRETWTACSDPAVTLDALAGRECYLGVDLSSKIDPSAVALIFPRAIDATSSDSLNLEADVVVRFWMPKNTLARREHEDRVPYSEWEQAGVLEATAGDLVDHDCILDFILRDVAERFHIRGIGIDMAGATAVVTRLQRELGDLVIEVPQGFRHLSEPSKQFEALIMAGRVRVAPNPMLDWNVANLAIEHNKWNEIRPVKLNSRQRIDGCVAIIDALAVMALKREPEYTSVFEDPNWELFTL